MKNKLIIGLVGLLVACNGVWAQEVEFRDMSQSAKAMQGGEALHIVGVVGFSNDIHVSTSLNDLSLPDVEVPSIEKQLEMYREIFKPYRGRESELGTLHIEGYMSMLRIAFSFTRKHVLDDVEKMQYLERFWSEAKRIMQQEGMTMYVFRLHIHRLAVLMEWKLSECGGEEDESRILELEKNYTLEQSSLYMLQIFEKRKKQFFEAIVCFDEGLIAYKMYIDAMMHKEGPLVLAALSHYLPRVKDDMCPRGFLNHDFTHNDIANELFNYELFVKLFEKIGAGGGVHLSRRDMAVAFELMHEVLLSQSHVCPGVDDLDKALRCWLLNTRNSCTIVRNCLQALWMPYVAEGISVVSEFRLISDNKLEVRVKSDFCPYISEDYPLESRYQCGGGKYYEVGYFVLEYNPVGGTHTLIEARIPSFDKQELMEQLRLNDYNLISAEQRLQLPQWASEMIEKRVDRILRISESFADCPVELVVYIDNIGQMLNAPNNEDIELLRYVYGDEVINSAIGSDSYRALIEVDRLQKKLFSEFVSEYAPLFRESRNKAG